MDCEASSPEALAKELPADRDELLRPFALADPCVVEELLLKAGFRDVRITREVRQAYLGLPSDARARVVRDVRESVRQFSANGQIPMHLVAHIAIGTR